VKATAATAFRPIPTPSPGKRETYKPKSTHAMTEAMLKLTAASSQPFDLFDFNVFSHIIADPDSIISQRRYSREKPL
jgi:hypothetical protein